MRITRIDCRLLRVPLERPVTTPNRDNGGAGLDHVFLLVVMLETDDGPSGLGFSYAFQGGRALLALAEDDLSPLLVGENPLDHERLGAKLYARLQSVGRRGLAAHAYAAVDLALWDLKGKVAGLPLYKLLGGARESAPIYASDTGWLWMSPQEVIAASRPRLASGMMGIKLRVGGTDPETDADRVQQVRDAFGEDLWLAVDAGQRYDYGTALAMGRFFEDDIGVAWFEEPISCEDVEGHRRLARKLDVPLAIGKTLYGRDEFQRYVESDAADVLQPDVSRLGGLTNWLKVAALAEEHHRPIVPHIMPEVAVHLACGLPHVTTVEHVPWFTPVLAQPPTLVEGRIVPPPRPGLGLELRSGALEEFGFSAQPPGNRPPDR